MSHRRAIRTILAVTVGLVATSVDAADWPRFRGPASDGRSAETGLLKSWPEEGPAELWRVPLGEGFSGIAAVDGRLYTMFATGGDEFVACFGAADGKPLWRTRVGARYENRFGNGPRATPTVAGGLVYALGAGGNLLAVSAADGSVAWSHDLVEAFGARIPQWGISASPLAYDGRLFVEVGGKAGYGRIAFDAATGEVVWHAGGDAAGYAMPLALSVGGVEQIVFFTAAGLVGLSASDGSELWRHGWKTSYDVNAAMPVWIPPDRLFVSSGYDVGAALLRLSVADGKVNVAERWRSREMKNQFSSSVLHDGHLYGFDDKTLRCLDADTGETRWRKRELGHGSLLVADGSLIVLGDAGTLVLADASPKAYAERGRYEAFNGKTWTMPTLADGILYLRDEQELLALKVGEPGASGGRSRTKTSAGE